MLFLWELLKMYAVLMYVHYVPKVVADRGGSGCKLPKVPMAYISKASDNCPSQRRGENGPLCSHNQLLQVDGARHIGRGVHLGKGKP